MINISLINGGYTNIIVSDNGCGIPRENFSKLCHFNATSKYNEESPDKYDTFGFHGASLASITCSCPTLITSRTRAEKIGTKGQFNYSTLVGDLQNAQCQYGTTIELNNLSDSVDQAVTKNIQNSQSNLTIKKLVQSYSALYYNISFKLLTTLPYESMTKKNLIQSLRAIYNIQNTPMHPISRTFECNNVKAALFVTLPEATSIYPQFVFFLNGQRIKNKALKKSVKSVYQRSGNIHTPVVFILFSEETPQFKFIPTNYPFPNQIRMSGELETMVEEAISIIRKDGDGEIDFDINEYRKGNKIPRYPIEIQPEMQNPYLVQQQTQQPQQQMRYDHYQQQAQQQQQQMNSYVAQQMTQMSAYQQPTSQMAQMTMQQQQQQQQQMQQMQQQQMQMQMQQQQQIQLQQQQQIQIQQQPQPQPQQQPVQQPQPQQISQPKKVIVAQPNKPMVKHIAAPKKTITTVVPPPPQQSQPMYSQIQQQPRNQIQQPQQQQPQMQYQTQYQPQYQQQYQQQQYQQQQYQQQLYQQIYQQPPPPPPRPATPQTIQQPAQTMPSPMQPVSTPQVISQPRVNKRFPIKKIVISGTK
ncbi:hypothetical protein TVAG_052060 [Trichomonas vaginalis G3]|uniref:Uncharacterized protein n=1 Tax=Trichomonas vaginalis (strain ATCC PRA-98 / G3) TaxID=412133 RepID=A2F4K2_TRIV3|nr:mismatched DNA binding [Trichomonas vaginalis G3]EAY00158.1 hypothetical protein TVAG_052060 [Trichomonas vaginalis G3]KAI5541123.1 mismatched DNA binding [Trichomonas vaginalis G3]|eukprot:XP_001313087.1 hypothetical protein [Trichomonas vaginalis G3]